MTFAARSVFGSGSNYVTNPLTPMSIQRLGLIGATHQGSINFNTDGTVTETGTGPDSSSVLSNWYAPTTASIGNSYWIKFTLLSGPAWDTGLVSGAINALTVQQLVRWTVTTSNISIGTVRVDIYSDAGGTTLVGTGTLSFDIESNN